MSVEGKKAALDRRPPPTAVRRSALAVAPQASSAQVLQRRLGNSGIQALIQQKAPRLQRIADAPVVRQATPERTAQASLSISSPKDPAEIEAGAIGKMVARMPEPVARAGVERTSDVGVSRSASQILQRAADKETRASSEVSAGIQSSRASGSPLPGSVRNFMEPRFGADFRDVRIHTGERAATLNRQVNARAFTVGRDVFFGRDQFKPDTQDGRELIAHELTHTIQQGAAIQRSEAPPSITQQSAPAIQRLGLSDALDYFADKANLIPGFRMFTIVLGVNPINMGRVDRSAANILRALIEFLPGGALITQALENSGVFEKAGAWIEQQIQTLGMTGAVIKQAIGKFLDSLSWRDIFDLGDVWERAKRIFTEPITRIVEFGKNLVNGIIRLVKDAILLPLAKLAEGTRGWDLLIGVLGRNPITGEAVARTATTLIPGFLKLIGQEEVWENMKKANALGRAWAWFQSALATVIGFVQQLPTLAINAFKSLELADIVLVPRAFAKVATVFAGFIGDFISWAGNALWNLLEIVFDVVSPGAFAYVKRTGAALRSILKNPLPFVRNLVAAAKLGFTNFAGNFLEHLKTGLIDWLTGSLPGVYIPKAFSLVEIAKFAFSVLGISWANIRQKLVKVVGETAVAAMETGFDIVVTLVRDGPGAAWDKIKEQLTNLKDMVIGGITDFVVDTVVKKAVPKLIAMFIPGAGFISAIISIYDTVMVFVEKLAKIVQVVRGFVDSIVAIAGGVIAAAAQRVESTLAGLLSLAISFLAGFVGLGKVADKIMGVIEKIRNPIDKAIDWLIAWIVKAAKTVVGKAKTAATGLLEWWRKKAPFRGGGESHNVVFEGGEENARLMVRSESKTPADFVRDFVPDGPTPPKITQLTATIASLQKSIVAAHAKSPRDDAAIAQKDHELTAKLNDLGAELAALLDKMDDEGSEKSPAPIDYPKRRAAAYPIIYCGPATAQFVDQSLLKEAADTGSPAKAKRLLAGKVPGLEGEEGFAKWPGTVLRFRADGGSAQSLPDGNACGLDPVFAGLAPGRILVYAEEGSTGGGSKINNLFRPYGFRPGRQGMDGDHVMERQLGGPDQISNLWPLPMGENRSSGATLKTLKVNFRGKEISVRDARQKRARRVLHLLIKSVRGG